MKIEAKIITDSINKSTSDRLTTFILKFPRIVLSEFNTHRAISKNSASSRAIPYKKMLKMVKEEPFIPIYFQEDHSGMQGTKNITGVKLKIVKWLWLLGRDFVVVSSYLLHKFKVTKQLCNRILEPFMWHTVIASATEWENFFALRAHKDAQPEIRVLAELMLEEYNKSIPEIKIPVTKVGACLYLANTGRIQYGLQEVLNDQKDWHIPYKDRMPEGLSMFDRLRVAIARCARTSYLTFDGEMNIEKDFDIYNKLTAGVLHASPFEHVAFPIEESKFVGNYKGWVQFRKLLPQESQRDDRVIKRKVIEERVI